jgi:hypothetical protein
MSAVAATRTLAPVAPRAASRRPVAAPAALAELSHHLIGALMQGVERIAALNVATTRALLVKPGTGTREQLEGTIDAWRFSWRSYEICSATAATVLRLVHAQTRAGFDDLWAALERSLAAVPQVDPALARELRCSFESMRSAYAAYFDATLNTHRCLLGLAMGAR